MTASLTAAEGLFKECLNLTFKYTSPTLTWCSGEHKKVKYLSLCVWWHLSENQNGLDWKGS